jgi:hypothetical protein
MCAQHALAKLLVGEGEHAQLAEGDSQPESTHSIFGILPFAGPKLAPDSDARLEPVVEACAAVDDGPGLPGEETADAERDEWVYAAGLLTVGEVIGHVPANMAKVPHCAVIVIPKG